MYTRRFFIRAILLLLILLLFGIMVAVLFSSVMSMQLAGLLIVPYSCFSLLMCVWSVSATPSAIRRAAYRLPIIFLVFQLAYFTLRYWLGVSYAPDLIGLGGIFAMVSIYGIIFGYLYIFIAEQYYISALFQQHAQNKVKFSNAKALINSNNSDQTTDKNQ
ncbi:MAG: hypothetical protein GXP08_13410 [Gammaproteobacteria bacterium]|nr:hypothetical protein [Gammaproteobacteria bacterium]